MKTKRKLRIETLAVHAGHDIDPATGAVAPPIHLSTTFEREADGGYAHGYIYSRGGNPTRHGLEEGLAALEAGEEAAAFGSGIAAASAIFQALAPGDHVVAPIDVYHGVTKLLCEVYVPWGLDVTFVDMTKLDDVKRAFGPKTKLVWTETPSNPLMKITDLAALAEIAHSANALCVCDNTLAPVVQRPLDHGADFVMHSTTKYLGGHSDVLGGAVVAKKAAGFFERIREIQGTTGGVPSPFDCWLILRGMPTLPGRMRVHSENALKIATWLADHPRVERVHYPGLAAHPGHEIAARQMSDFSGMLSFEVKSGAEAALGVAAKMEIFIRATSLGGVESLIEHRASTKGEDPRTPQGLLRLSIGLEHPDDLIEDLAEAME
ncbi:MAG: aminotransferase class I/II-fold pyridoxal phosphate-dependent enzyme [Verrucomicrobiota bacterium]|nr:aminotransferase class I/II-fold pyridoxal phosphate-dependent enzyme [Verrucomicrobiota bacterium]